MSQLKSSSRKAPPQPQPSRPQALTELSGPPPLLPGEDATAYDALQARLTTDIAPQDIIEEILAQEVGENQWQKLRLRRLEMELLRVSVPKALVKVLIPVCSNFACAKTVPGRFLGIGGASKLAQAWAAGEPEAIDAVRTLLRAANLTMDAVLAQGFADNIQVFEQIERIIRMNALQRDDNLREIARRRAGSDKARRAVTQIENAEFAQSISDKSAPDNPDRSNDGSPQGPPEKEAA
jgi:hypothetical protein